MCAEDAKPSSALCVRLLEDAMPSSEMCAEDAKPSSALCVRLFEDAMPSSQYGLMDPVSSPPLTLPLPQLAGGDCAAGW